MSAKANASMHEGKWERSRFTGVELYEKTLAIFGLGRVGGLVAERARAFGMELVGYDPYCSPERAEQLGVKLYDTVDEIVPLADFITVHLPKTEARWAWTCTSPSPAWKARCTNSTTPS